MKFIINILCYGLGIMWLILGLVGVYDPNIFAKNDIVSLNVVLATHQPDTRRSWFSVFSLLMLGLAVGRSVGFLPYFEGLEEKRVIYAGIEYLMALIFFIKSKI